MVAAPCQQGWAAPIGGGSSNLVSAARDLQLRSLQWPRLAASCRGLPHQPLLYRRRLLVLLPPAAHAALGVGQRGVLERLNCVAGGRGSKGEQV